MYIAFLLGGVVEFPGYTVGFATFKLGRKPVFIFCMLMSGLSSVGIVIVELYAKGKDMDRRKNLPNLTYI